MRNGPDTRLRGPQKGFGPLPPQRLEVNRRARAVGALKGGFQGTTGHAGHPAQIADLQRLVQVAAGVAQRALQAAGITQAALALVQNAHRRQRRHARHRAALIQRGQKHGRRLPPQFPARQFKTGKRQARVERLKPGVADADHRQMFGNPPPEFARRLHGQACQAVGGGQEPEGPGLRTQKFPDLRQRGSRRNLRQAPTCAQPGGKPLSQLMRGILAGCADKTKSAGSAGPQRTGRVAPHRGKVGRDVDHRLHARAVGQLHRLHPLRTKGLQPRIADKIAHYPGEFLHVGQLPEHPFVSAGKDQDFHAPRQPFAETVQKRQLGLHERGKGDRHHRAGTSCFFACFPHFF